MSKELLEALESLVGHNLPTCYDGDDDDVGGCPYCHGWNMHHDATCEVVKAQEVISNYKQQLKEES